MKILCARFSPIHNLFIYVTYRSALNRNDGTWYTPYTNVNNNKKNQTTDKTLKKKEIYFDRRECIAHAR